jgi:ligand-binding sensor domain-containing protein
MNNCFNRFVLLIWMQFLMVFLFAQSPANIHYDVSSGLPSNEVYGLKIDRKGFLWIGTSAGLVRYDGNSFFLLNNPRSRGTSVSGLQEDQFGKIWFNNFSGQLFYTSKDSVSLFQPWELYYKRQMAEFCFDKMNRLVVNNNENQIFRFDLAKKQVTKLLDSTTEKLALARMHDGSILYTRMSPVKVFELSETNATEVAFYNLEKKRLLHPPLINQFQFYTSFEHRQTLALQRRSPLEKNPYLFYYKDHAIYVHPATTLLQQLHYFPLSAYDDDAGNLFVGTEKGLLWIRLINGKYELKKLLFSNEAISSIIKGKEGGIWISTLKNGIFQIPNLNFWIVNGLDIGLETNGVSKIAIDQKLGKIFAASFAGEVFEFRKFSKLPTIPYGLSKNNDVQAMSYDTFTKKLYVSKMKTEVVDPPKRTFKELQISASSKDYSFRKDGVIFCSGKFVLAAFPLNRKDLFNKIVQEFNLNPKKAAGEYGEGFYNLTLYEQRNKGLWFQEARDNLWVGFVDGLKYHHQNQWKKVIDPITGEPIIAIHFSEMPDGTICIATVDQGLFLIKNEKIVLHLNEQNGLLSNRIKRVATDHKSIWMVMPNAIQGYNIKSKQFSKLLVASDVHKQEVFDLQIFKDTVYLATSNGILFFPMDINTKNMVTPFASISSIQVDGKQYEIGKELNLPFSSNNIIITLQGIALKSGGNFLYQYRLMGTDTSWVSINSSENLVRFTALPPGKYTFQSRVLNEDGVISSQTPSIQFIIAQQWWKKWWFLLILILAMLGVAVYFFLVRIGRLKKLNQEEMDKVRVLEEMRHSQLSALKAQMNPHFMFNALNSIQEIILMNDKKQANMYLGKFADLMRITLDQSNKNAISLEDELKALQLYLELEALRFETHFQYHIQIDEQIFTQDILIPAMLIQPYVENAIKHGLLHKQGNKELVINFSLQNLQTLLCMIMDNGIGRKRSAEINQMREKKHTSFATGATMKRLELLNYNKKQNITVEFEDLSDEKGNDSGTKVLLYIPLLG